jgi:transcriptional regulator with XRE-family HTH domain
MLLKRGDGKFSHWERNRMTISEKIFELLRDRGMTQKEFAQATGIAESSISDWKRKKTNPVSEKILIICEVLGVTPYELLSGTEGEGKRSMPSDYLVLDKSTEIGQFVVEIQKMDSRSRERLMGYFYALKEMKS